MLAVQVVFPRTSTELTEELSPTNTTPAITTISVCPTCPPIPVTCTTQPITSWCSSSTTKTATTCTTGGIYNCGGEFYVVKDSEWSNTLLLAKLDMFAPTTNAGTPIPALRVSNKFLFSSTSMKLRLAALGKIGIAMYVY